MSRIEDVLSMCAPRYKEWWVYRNKSGSYLWLSFRNFRDFNNYFSHFTLSFLTWWNACAVLWLSFDRVLLLTRPTLFVLVAASECVQSSIWGVLAYFCRKVFFRTLLTLILFYPVLLFKYPIDHILDYNILIKRWQNWSKLKHFVTVVLMTHFCISSYSHFLIWYRINWHFLVFFRGFLMWETLFVSRSKELVK